ncbi:MAG: flagellar biosynthesis anti-sigma factor FlgM [Phycisphaeraceae bacterium]
MNPLSGPQPNPASLPYDTAARSRTTPAQSNPSPAAADRQDTVELSQDAIEYARRLEISGQRIHEIRTQIAEGVYDTPERFDAALDKMIAALSDEDDAGT